MDSRDLSVSALAHDRDGTCAVVTLAGRAGIAEAGWFRQLLELPEAHESGRIILDLSRLSSIDWWAALILLWVGRMVSRRGGTLVLASPQPAVARLLTTTGAAQVVTVYQSVPQAYGSRRRSRGHGRQI
jgi:anti-anti-sigma factor